MGPITATEKGEPVTRQINASTLLGVTEPGMSGVVSFRGLPFAQAPTGELRWRPPQPRSLPSGEVDATRFAPACPQDNGNHQWYADVAAAFGRPASTVPALPETSEDCLYLNIWAPGKLEQKPLPVMVWIHGGSNVNGWSFEPDYRGASLAARGVVVVSIAYRLGALGFLAHPDLSAESPLGVSGNYGLLDQIAALKWLQQNIAEFGGDPGNITVFGESAGAADILYLMTTPLTKGLFHKAIVQSGGYGADLDRNLEKNEQIGLALTKALGIPEDNPLPAMRQVPADTLVNTAASALGGHYWDGTLDGLIFPHSPAASFARGLAHPVPIIIGSNRNESLMYLDEGPNDKPLQKAIESVDERHRKTLGELLSNGHPKDKRRQLDRLSSAQDMLCPSQFVARSLAAARVPAYAYYFTRVRPGGDSIGAYHGAEISYAFGSKPDWLPTDQRDLALSEVMGDYWTSFARNGAPESPGNPAWPSFQVDMPRYLELGDTTSTGESLEHELCRILDLTRTHRLLNQGEY